MLSAAGGAIDIFKGFLQIGVPLDCYNTRGHSVKDLSTNEEILNLTQKHFKAK